MSIHKWLNWPKRDARTLSPAFRQLVNAASQQPVPEEGKMIGLPVAVLKIGFRPFRQARVSSGNIEERWSSIATIMARVTRSGTLVGPGTNRKWRPAIMILRVLLGYTLNKTIGSSATVVAAPKMSVFIDHDIQNWKRVSQREY